MRCKISFAVAFVFMLCELAGSKVNASDVRAQLSDRQAYVGAPIVLRIEIENGVDFEAPTIPDIADLMIESLGGSQSSSQITIINGRRSVQSTQYLNYRITPRAPGEYVIPALDVVVDGRTHTTEPLSFVATKSDTGDLLFVEIVGDKEQVYVGESLNLTLRIWVKTYRNEDYGVKLSEGDMWQLISNQSSWGSFETRLRELAENNRRPGGDEVLRDNGQGERAGYFLYEIEATEYPKKGGSIEANDVQIIVDYPVALGRSRDPFESMLGGSPFGNSPLADLMNDGFFDSPFRNRIAITETRPIVASASVDATQVIPIPEAGKPDDYRGAVGKYEISVRAAQTSVQAGDPIKVEIAIDGDGPMEYVQAPPLSELNELSGFSVSTQSLAGYVEGQTKYFITSLRPKSDRVTEIPAIPFSFFNPESETFETVRSEPIAIEVTPADRLDLENSIASQQTELAANGRKSEPSDGKANPQLGAFSELLDTPSDASFWRAAWLFGVFAPIGVGVVLLAVRCWHWLKHIASTLRRPEVIALPQIERASCPSDIATALRGVCQRYARESAKESGWSIHQAAGFLRTNGLYELAARLETFELAGQKVASDSLTTYQDQAITWLRDFRSEWKFARSNLNGKKSVATISKATVLLFACLSVSAGDLQAWGGTSDGLSHTQMETSSAISNKALREWKLANDRLKDIAAEVRLQSSSAEEIAQEVIRRYENIVQFGETTPALYANLGLANKLAGKNGAAIAAFEQARRFDPTNRRIAKELYLLRESGDMPQSFMESLSIRWNQVVAFLEAYFGYRMLALTSVLSGTFLVVVMLMRWRRFEFPFWALAAGLSCVLGFASSCLICIEWEIRQPDQAIVLLDATQVHESDGESFPVIGSIAAGRRVKIIHQRQNWVEIQDADLTGWVSKDAVQRLQPAAIAADAVAFES